MKNINAKGFSLVELMVVVAIIGILAMIAVPSFSRFQAKARQSSAKTLLSSLYVAEMAYHSEWLTFFADFRNLGFTPVGNISFRVGFGGPGVANAASYVGPGVAARATAQQYSTKQFCSSNGAACQETPYGLPMAEIGTGNIPPTMNTFTAMAIGDIDGSDDERDTWTINERRVISNPISDL